MTKIETIVTFERYLPIDFTPYYVFTTADRYIVNCKDYPRMLGRLAPYQKCTISAIMGEAREQGVILNNVEWLSI